MIEAPQVFYRVRLALQHSPEGQSMWTAQHPTLPGCHVVRADAAQALNDLAGAREEWLAKAAELDIPVPAPEPDMNYEMILADDHSPAEAAQAEAALQSASTVEPLVFVQFAGSGLAEAA